MNQFIKNEDFNQNNNGKYYEPRRHVPKGRTAIVSQPVKHLIPQNKSDADFYGRKLTFQITKENTIQLQVNIQMIVDFLNKNWQLTGSNEIIGNSVKNSVVRIWTRTTKLIVDFKKGEYDREFFLNEVKKIVEL